MATSTRLPTELKKYVLSPVANGGASLARALLGCVRQRKDAAGGYGLRLAAAFDLLVAAKYYDYVKPENWLWCQCSQLDFYPFLNTCPFCCLQNVFVHHPGNKLGSGTIGPVTAEALRELLVEHFAASRSKEVTVHRGREPVDIAIVDWPHRSVFLAEVKAAPLFTPPLAIDHVPAFFDAHVVRPLNHVEGTLRSTHLLRPKLVIPSEAGGHWLWDLEHAGMDEPGWAARALAKQLTADNAIFERWVLSWKLLWQLYEQRDTSHTAFWFTGACGRPQGTSEGWQQDSSGRSTGSVSDGKTSVGMDRTDDIKKSTFQVLNLGVQLRQRSWAPWNLRIGLMSNLHAARHHRKYLAPYEDIVWGWASASGKRPTDVFNLFDGIISFSVSHTRDSWLGRVIDWH